MLANPTLKSQLTYNECAAVTTVDHVTSRGVGFWWRDCLVVWLGHMNNGPILLVVGFPSCSNDTHMLGGI